MKISFEKEIGYVFNQLQTSSCTCNAVSSMLSFFAHRQGYYTIPFSRLYLYYNTRLLQGDVQEDTGCFPEFVLEAIARFGMCPESMWPLQEDKMTQKPSDECYRFAQKFPFSLTVDMFSISGEENWVETMTRHLGNGRLLLCCMSRFSEQHVDGRGIVSSVAENGPTTWLHSIVAVGIDDEEQKVLFLNSHGVDDDRYRGFFTMTFEQVASLNPFGDTVYALGGRFENDTEFTIEIRDAVLDYHRHALPVTETLNILELEGFTASGRVYDHVIVGAGITGRYLAYRLHQKFPRDSVLIVDPSDSKTQSFDTNVVRGHLLCQAASHYSPIFSKSLQDLVDELGLPTEPQDEMYSEACVRELRADPHLSKLFHIIFQEFGVAMDDEENVKENLDYLFTRRETASVYYESFLELYGMKRQEWQQIVGKLRETILPEKGLYYFLKCVCNSYVGERHYLRESISKIREALVDEFIKVGFGDFMVAPPPSTLPTFIHGATVTSWDERLSTCALQLTTRKARTLSSHYMISFKNLYHCSLTQLTSSAPNYIELTSVVHTNVFFFLSQDVSPFSPLRMPGWGMLNYLGPRLVNCGDMEYLVFQKMQMLASPIQLLNNVVYDLSLLSEVMSFVHQEMNCFTIEAMVFYDYPNQVGNQVLVRENEPFRSFYDRMMHKINAYGSIHTLDTNYGPYPCEVAGGITMVDDLLSTTTRTIGILIDREVYEAGNTEEIDALCGLYKSVLFYDCLVEDLEAWLDSVDAVYVAGSSYHVSPPTSRDVSLFSHLLSRVKAKNDNGTYFPLIGVCFGFQLLVLSESNSVMSRVEGENHLSRLSLTTTPFGTTQRISTAHPVYLDNGFGFLPHHLVMPASYQTTHMTTDRAGTEIVATMESSQYPIYGFQWHPFLPLTRDWIGNVQLLKRILSGRIIE